MAKSVDLYKKAVELSQSFDEHFLELAKTLRTLQETDLDSFRDCVLNSGIGLRKAYYLVNLDKTFGSFNIAPSRLREIGWTKLMLLSKHVTKQNLKTMLKMAEDNNVRDLKILLAGGKPDDNSHCIMMYFNAKDYADLTKALTSYGAGSTARGMQNKEEALMKLVRSRKS